MNPSARTVADRARALCASVITAPGPAIGLLRAYAARRRDMRWIPPGGTSPLGILGHVNAALELAEQVARGEMPRPARVVLPVGSGGTAAGLALGFAIAKMDTVIVGARVAPRIAAGRTRVLALAGRERRYLERLAGERIPRVDASRDVSHKRSEPRRIASGLHQQNHAAHAALTEREVRILDRRLRQKQVLARLRDTDHRHP